MVNLATYVGSTQAGISGALAATSGVILPSFCIILLITAILKNIIKNKFFQAVLQGMKPCITGIILATGLHLIISNLIYYDKKIIIDYQVTIIMIVLVVIMSTYKKITQKKLSPIALIVISAFVGIAVCGIV